MRQVIGVFGQQRNGKTTLAHRLCKDLNREEDQYLGMFAHQPWFVRPTIARFRQVLSLVYGLTDEEIEAWKLKDEKPPGWNMTMRDAMRHLTTEGFEAVCPTTWIDTVLKPRGRTIFDNGRMFEEAEATKQAGGVTILIYRGPDFKNYSNHKTEFQMQVAYETCFTREGELIGESPMFDFYCSNTGTLEDLHIWSKHYATSILELLKRRTAHGQYPNPMGSDSGVSVTESSP